MSSASIALATLMATGCESALFAAANLGRAPADGTATYDPERQLAVDIYRPVAGDRNSPVDKLPVVVFLYGGGWQRGAREQYRFAGRRLAENGVVALVADYRTWPDAGFPGFVEDGARAVAWAHANAGRLGGDPQRLFVAGHSAGAQIAALLGTDPRYLRDVGLSPGDLSGVIGLSGPYDFVISGQYRKIFGPASQWPQAQALNHVDGAEPPFLLIHGDADRVVESRDSVQLADSLRAHSVPARLVLLPDAGHSAPLLALYRPTWAPDVIPAIVEFIAAPQSDVGPADSR